jgi:NAD/NADP transhydrogenase alpha subunit
VICATTNVVGGFIITDRMLGMFKRTEKPAEKPTDAPAGKSHA